MSAPTLRRTSSRLWNDHVWPVATGALVAIGLLAGWTTYGLLTSSLFAAGVGFFCVTSVLAILADTSLSVRRSLTWGGLATLVVCVGAGLGQVSVPLAWSAVAASVATCPAVLAALRRVLSRRWPSLAHRPAHHRSAPRPGPASPEVERAFQEIVAQFGRDPGGPGSGDVEPV